LIKLTKELRAFEVIPSVVKAGETTEISIIPKSEKIVFEPEGCVVRIAPRERRHMPRNEKFCVRPDKYHDMPMFVENGAIKFSFDFKYEQEYRIIILNKKGEKALEFSVYALEEDLYGLLPYKGDLHLHTIRSDGGCTIPQVVSSYREAGFDFICMTDHHKREPSIEAAEMIKDVDTGFTVFPGEEVHNCKMGYFHLVNFNGSYSVNEVLEADYDNLFKKLREEAKTFETPDGIDAFEFLFRKWICDEIRKSGGKAIFCHPFWVTGEEYHTEIPMTFYSMRQGIYDIFEVIGGCTADGNHLQTAVYSELRAEGIDMPIVGSSDAHECFRHEGNSKFDERYTIVFAKDISEISEAIMDHRSVAIHDLKEETPRAFGHFRLVKYAQFLLNNFYPMYAWRTRHLGAFMRAYLADGDCKKTLERVNQEAQSFKNRYFGR